MKISFGYTNGRWLWDERKQLRQRYKQFSIHELKSTAEKSVGARVCVSMIKLAEGGFNKVFRLTMDNGKVVIARILNPNAGHTFRTVASEVATIDFVRPSFGFGLEFTQSYYLTFFRFEIYSRFPFQRY